jgi:hypothetical protein
MKHSASIDQTFPRLSACRRMLALEQRLEPPAAAERRRDQPLNLGHNSATRQGPAGAGSTPLWLAVEPCGVPFSPSCVQLQLFPHLSG